MVSILAFLNVGILIRVLPTDAIISLLHEGVILGAG